MRHSSRAPAYRPDIDGLRALAVLAVIAFHLDSAWLPGGFTGVDVFFVISGFLITRIILSGIHQQAFSLAAFHAGRIRRIFPALFLVVICSLLFGLLVLVPSDLRALDKSAFSSLFFLANHHFAPRADYFAPAAEEQPLLHLWSLGVEVQFYLLWPLLILLWHRIGFTLKPLLVFTLALAGASLVGGTLLALQPGMASWSYYLLPTRAVALLIGSALALGLQLRPGSALPGPGWQLAGMGLLLCSTLLINAQSLYPGYNGLWPSLGAAFIIYGGSRPGPVHTLLTAPLSVYLGKISYSLYLWHWPVLAYMRYLQGENQLPPAMLAAAVLLTWALADLSWRWVEQPARKGRYPLRRTLLHYHALPAVLILIGAGISKATEGLPGRSPFFAPAYTEVTDEKAGCYKKLRELCRVGDPVGVDSRTLLVGDSHGGHYDRFFDRLSHQDGFHLAVKTHPGCTVIKLWSGEKPETDKCERFARNVRLSLDDYQRLILAGRWDERLAEEGEAAFADALERTLGARPADQQLIIMAQVPRYHQDVYRSWVNNQRFSLALDKEVDETYRKANAVVRAVAARFPNVLYLPVDKLLCQNDGCRIQAGGMPLYKDDDHLNQYGSEVLAKLYLDGPGQRDISQLFLVSNDLGHLDSASGAGGQEKN